MSMRSTPLRKMATNNTNGGWECNDCGKEFRSNDADHNVGKLFCPRCGSGNLRQVL